MDVIDELITHCEAWEPWARVMGNVRAGDAAQALRRLRAEFAECRTVKESLLVALERYGTHAPEGMPCGLCEAVSAALREGGVMAYPDGTIEDDDLRMMDREIQRLRAELANKDQILGDTLAVLCGDGGHYRAEHGDIKAKEHGLKRYHDLLVSEDGLRAELAECKRDAERYRFLRAHWDHLATNTCYENGEYHVIAVDLLEQRNIPLNLETLDAEIDAALAAEEGTK